MKRKILWGFLGLLLVLTFVWPMISLPTAHARLASLPLQGRSFRAKALELEQADKDFLGKATAVQHLVALKGGGRLVLTVIDGTRDRHAVHDPSYCFSGAGWSITHREEVTTAKGKAALARMDKTGESAQALWFFDDGKNRFTSPMEFWIRTSARRITVGLSGEEPVLVLMRSLPGPAIDWDRVREDVLPELGF